MKFKPDVELAKKSIYAFLVLASTFIFILLVNSIGPVLGWLGKVIRILKPATYGFVIAFLLNPALRSIEDRLLPRISQGLKPGKRRGIAILLTYLLAFCLLMLFVAIVLPQVVESCVTIAGNVPYYYKSIQKFYYTSVEEISKSELFKNEEFAQIFNELAQMLYASTIQLFEKLGIWLAGLGGKIISFAGSLANGVLDIVLGIIISIYLLADREKLFAQVKKIINAIFPGRACEFLYGIVLDTNRIFNGFIIGKIIDSAIIGVLCFISMSLLRMPYVVLISVIVGITNVIPYFGPFIGAIPSFLLIFITNRAQSFGFLVFIFVLQQLDGNFIGPKILGDTVGIAPIWIVISIMLFSGLLGPIGMFIGVPVFAVIYQLFKRFISFLLVKRGLSANTRDYGSEQNPLIK